MSQKEGVQQFSTFQVVNAAAGSGKTFTLVKSYLEILLKSKNPNKFQQILAVTFTNKAAGEMKERVVQMLNRFVRQEENDMLYLICEDTGLEKDVIFSRSKQIIEAIFRRYSSFNIVTIDSFTHHLIRTFAYDLQLPLNFEVELDPESLLHEAVDQVISKIGDDRKLTTQLVEFAFQKMDADKSWDISGDLKAFSSLILNENNSAQFRELQDVDPDEFRILRRRLTGQNQVIKAELKRLGELGNEQISNSGLDDKDFYYSLLPKHFQFLKTDFRKAKFFDQNKLKTRIEEGVFYAKSKTDAVKSIIDGLLPSLLKYYRESENLYREYVRNELIIDSLNPLAVLNHIYSALNTIKEENNVLLNAEFNEMIADTIKNEPAPFIYERLGDKFKYYFIDEMQDTSVRQWQNLIPLVENALTSENEIGERGELVMVGDSKQAIYRWRGGKAEQFIALGSENEASEGNPFFLNKKVVKLDTNYRSYSNIIDFNNKFFKFVSNGLSNARYKNLYLESSEQLETNKVGGFVQLSFLEKNPETDFYESQVPDKVFRIIEELDSEFQRSELCILVRTKKQGVAIANYLAGKNIPIISSETLLIANSKKVSFIIDLLNYLMDPNDQEAKTRCLYFLFDHWGVDEPKHAFISGLIYKSREDFFENLTMFGSNFSSDDYIQKSLYDGIEYIIRTFNLSKKSDANLQFFLDLSYEFQLKNQTDLPGFLAFWELKKEKLSIVAPEAQDSVRIMTIHKAKGLEFPVVIFPYDMEIYKQIDPKIWYEVNENSSIKSSLIAFKSELQFIDEQGAELYRKRREELELDTINLLYVTLTRAQEQLFIITEKISASGREALNRTSAYFINFLENQGGWDEGKTDYYFGHRKRISKKKPADKKHLLQERLITTAWSEQQIAVLARSNILWGTEQGAAITYGNLLHGLLAEIKTKSDIDEIVHQFVFRGLISLEDSLAIISLLYKLVEHPKLKNCFSQNNRVLCEQEIMTGTGKVVIPDRLVISDNTLSIVEYKTGKKEKKHKKQVEDYVKILEDMGYEIDKKLLVYMNDKITVEEV